MSEPCGMCRGTGKVETWEYLDGGQVYMTTDAEANKTIERENKSQGQKIVSINCQTCDGSGITPVYLLPEYWQGRLDEANEQLDHAFFGLGRFIRRAMEKESE